MNNFNFKSYDTIKQTISYCEVDKCPAVIKLREQLEAYKMEAEEGREINAELKADNEHLSEKEKEARHYLEEAEKFKNCLTEIKEIAEIINDRTMVASYICDHLDKILQKISECEINYEN